MAMDAAFSRRWRLTHRHSPEAPPPPPAAALGPVVAPPRKIRIAFVVGLSLYLGLLFLGLMGHAWWAATSLSAVSFQHHTTQTVVVSASGTPAAHRHFFFLRNNSTSPFDSLHFFLLLHGRRTSPRMLSLTHALIHRHLIH